MCWLKTLHGLHPFARYDAQHRRCSFDVAFMFNVKQKGWANVGQKKSKKVLELVVLIDQEKDNANSQQMT